MKKKNKKEKPIIGTIEIEWDMFEKIYVQCEGLSDVDTGGLLSISFKENKLIGAKFFYNPYAPTEEKILEI